MNKRAQTEPDPSRFTQLIKKLFARDSEGKDAILDTLRQAEKNAIVDADALSIMEGAMQVREMQVREIMVPRSQMVSVKHDMDSKELLEKILACGHSRFPVIDDDPDKVIGILIAKDLLSLQLNEKLNIKDKMRPATFIPESKRVNVLLKEFRDKRNHMAIVVSEYGDVSGLVTIEDVLEQIVGDIADEHDIEETADIKSLNDHRYIVKATTLLEDFNEYFLSNFSDKEFETIGGIIIKHFERLPKRGETISIDGFNFTILNANTRSIKLLKVILSDEQLEALKEKALDH